MQPTYEDLTRLTSSELVSLLLETVLRLLFAGGSRLSPVFLLSMILIGLALYLRRRPGVGFWGWIFPATVWRTQSTGIDIKLWLFGVLLRVVGLGSIVALAPALTTFIQNALAGPNAPNSTWPPLALAAVLLIAADFSTYWTHRIFHEIPRLWPFHAVHHTAEVLNPVTAYRKHPVYDVFSLFAQVLLIGTTQGILLGLFVGQVDIATNMGVNLLYYTFNLAGANLRHSHIWLSFGRRVEHLIISPAQHQIHHSMDPRHFNKNYGEVLAIWDWMFGSLYVPEGPEDLRFGLADTRGNPLPQPHPTLRRALFEPFRAAFGRRRPGTQISRAPETPTPLETAPSNMAPLETAPPEHPATNKTPRQKD